MKKDWGKEGFSLVEVMIAVAVLAVLTVPILAYFANASTTTVRGRQVQRANQAAESAAEELKGYSDFAQLENVGGAGDWTVISSPKPWEIPSPAPGATKQPLTSLELKKKVSVDGRDYTAVAKVDYKSYTRPTAHPSASSTPSAEYNEYLVPQLQEVYSDSNVVAVESDQKETALSDFLYQAKNKGLSLGSSPDMKRTILLQIRKNKDDSDVYDVKVSYRYECTSFSADPYVDDVISTKIERKNMKRIYLFYNPMSAGDDAETVSVQVDTGNDGYRMESADAKKLSVYFVPQKVSDTKKGKITIAVTSPGIAYGTDYNSIHYYSDGGNFASGVTYRDTSILHEEKSGNRIAEITIDIYDGYEDTKTSYSQSDRLAHIQTSKGE